MCINSTERLKLQCILLAFLQNVYIKDVYAFDIKSLISTCIFMTFHHSLVVQETAYKNTYLRTEAASPNCPSIKLFTISYRRRFAEHFWEAALIADDY